MEKKRDFRRRAEPCINIESPIFFTPSMPMHVMHAVRRTSFFLTRHTIDALSTGTVRFDQRRV